jgi:uncharacterized linocin/CFP29 family protein
MNDVILNGQATGSVAALLAENNFDTGIIRPYIDTIDGRDRHLLTVHKDGKPREVLAHNATSLLRKDQWQLLDTQVIKAARERLRAVQDLLGANLTFNIPNGMGTTVLQTETMSHVEGGNVSMDGLRQGQNDRPTFELTNLPLPIIHEDFFFSARQIATSRSMGTPLDTSMAEQAGRIVAETAEKLLVGTYGTYTFGGGSLYGYINHPDRLTKTLTNPTTSGWTGNTFVKEVLAMKAQLVAQKYYGPYIMYVSPAWDEYLDDDYSTAKGDNTLRERVEGIDSINDVRTLDFLGDGFVCVLVQMTSDVVREVIGMSITTVQWPTQGGLQQNFKVMAIMTPQIRSRQGAANKAGIVHGTV